jgi:hypothetical protein
MPRQSPRQTTHCRTNTSNSNRDEDGIQRNLRSFYEFEFSLLSSETLILIKRYPVSPECDEQKCRIFSREEKEIYNADIDGSLTKIAELAVLKYNIV